MFERHLHTEAYERHAITSLTFYFEWFSQNQLFTALSMALFPSELDTLPSPAAQLHFNYVRTGGGEGRRNLPAVTLRRRAVPRSKPTLRRRRAAAGAAGGAGVDKAAVAGRCPDGAGPRLGGVTVPSLLRAAGRARSHARPVPRAALRGGRMRPLRPWALLLGALLGTAAAAARSYPHVAVLDGAAAYRLLWGRRGSALAFRLEVRTRGYVGFGLSAGGGMASADIVVGGVEGGQPYLQVRTRIPCSLSGGRPCSSFSPRGRPLPRPASSTSAPLLPPGPSVFPIVARLSPPFGPRPANLPSKLLHGCCRRCRVSFIPKRLSLRLSPWALLPRVLRAWTRMGRERLP